MHRRRPGPQRRVGRDRNTTIALHRRVPGDDTARDGGEIRAVADDGDGSRRDVEDPDQARDAVAGHVVGARVRRRVLLGSWLEEQDAAELVAAVHVDVAPALQIQADRRRPATRNEERNRARRERARTGGVRPGARVDAVGLVREVAAWWGSGRWIGVGQAGRDRRLLEVWWRGPARRAVVDGHAPVGAGVSAERETVAARVSRDVNVEVL